MSVAPYIEFPDMDILLRSVGKSCELFADGYRPLIIEFIFKTMAGKI